MADAGRAQLESFRLGRWASRRRHDLLELLDRLTPTIAELTQAIEQEAEKCPEAQRLQTHPGVGALTALAFVLIIGKHGAVSVWQAGRELSGAGAVGGFERAIGDGWDTSPNRVTRCCAFFWWKRRRLRCAVIQEWRNRYFHLVLRRGRKIAKVAMARRLAVRLYWMWRKGWDYEQLNKFGSHAGQPGNRDGVQ